MVEAEKKKEVFTQTRRERNFLFQKGGEGREAQPLGGGGCGGGGAAAKSGDCDSFCRGAQ